ncbi:MAG TPA: CdaR family protein [Anaerolineaceae bacterium]|nr:CdaR family protein [Anaerolineaceae bacterium]HPN52738.1 CdaR family protein [Anaerolineaceae bacterium]
MANLLRQFFKHIPSLILAFILATAVWISATNTADPNEEKVFPRAINLEYVGMDPGLTLINDPTRQVVVTLKAPSSIWKRLVSENNHIKATVDLSGLGSGTYTLSPQVFVDLRPVEITNISPANIELTFDRMATRQFPVHLIIQGQPAIGFQAGDPQLDRTSVTISGPETLVNRVADVTCQMDLRNANEEIRRKLTLQAVDANNSPVSGLTLSPESVVVTQPITQRGGYRNVVVKVMVTGQVASGYRLTNIYAYPAAVTVYSSDPKAVDNLPGYIETQAIDLTGVKDDITKEISLNLPSGISVVGNSNVTVQIGIAAIEGSITLSNMSVQVASLDANLTFQLSLNKVDVILSGPLYLLDQLNPNQVKIWLDVTGLPAGTYKLTPRVEVAVSDIRTESILPSSVEVTLIQITPTPTPTLTSTPHPSPTPTVTPTPTRTPKP